MYLDSFPTNGCNFINSVCNSRESAGYNYRISFAHTTNRIQCMSEHNAGNGFLAAGSPNFVAIRPQISMGFGTIKLHKQQRVPSAPMLLTEDTRAS